MAVKFWAWLYYWFSRSLCMVVSWVYFPIRVHGWQHVKSQRAAIFAANHLSNIDPVVLGVSVRRPVSFMAKDMLFRNPLFDRILRWGGAFPVRRQAADIGALREAIRRLKSGSSLILFPQGTRSRQETIPKAQSGIGFLVAKGQVPVIPVRVFATEKVLPPQARWFRRHRVHIVFGPPLHFQPTDDYGRIADDIMTAIATLRLPDRQATPVFLA